MRMTHSVCGGSISHLKYCAECQSAVEAEHIRKAVDVGGGNRIELEENELKELAPPSSRTFLVEQFVRDDELEPVGYKRHYYVGPDEVGTDAYRLLRDGLLRSGKAGIGYVTLRSAQSLAALRASPSGVVLSTLHYADEIRESPAKAAARADDESISEAHLEAFGKLLAAMTTPFDRSRYPNRHQEALRQLVDRKLARRAPAVRDEPPSVRREDGASELLASVRRSLEQLGPAAFPFDPGFENPLHPH